MNISKVLAGIAVSEIERAKPWYEVLFDRPPDAEPMPGLTEWHIEAGVVQLVADGQRAGGSLVTLWVPDARAALESLAARGGPSVAVDDSTSEKVLFATLTDSDGNAITIVEVREGMQP
jgi:predicted enzyme related to lactoylglutathione lyase